MASKLKFKRVFLKDRDGNYYRIFSIANGKDHMGEYYVKLVFPDIKNFPLVTGKYNGKENLITEIDNLSDGVDEFTYHYRAGVSHLKNSNEIIAQEKQIPTLLDNQALHLVRFVIRSLKTFEVQKESKVTKEDFVLPIIFDEKARAFELAISRISGEWSVTNAKDKDPVHTYKLALEDPNVSFHIADCIWTRPPISKGDAIFEIFRYGDPKGNFVFKEI